MINTINHYLLDIIEKNIFPETATVVSVKEGRVFGAAIVDQEGRHILHSTNQIISSQNPLMHGEVATLTKAFAELRTNDLSKYILLSTHEPCPMCISAAYWSGIQTIYYLFSYEDTDTLFQMPDDLMMCKELFGTKHPRVDNSLIRLTRITEPKERVKLLYKRYIELFNDHGFERQQGVI